MKLYNKKLAFQATIVCSSVLLLLWGCTKVPAYSEDYDIKWPVPKITSITPLKDTIGKTITISGESFDKVTRVTIGNPETQATVISSSATSIKVTIPRTVAAGPVTVYTNYKQKGVSEDIFTPVYLDAKVNNWPLRITRGQAFIIKGVNMDMITEVEVDGNKIAIASGSTADQVSISTQGLTLPDKVIVKVTKAKASIINGTSPLLTVENPSNFFIPEAAVVLFDFENGVNPFVPDASNQPTTAALNGSGAPKARDAKYLTVTKTSATNWQDLGTAPYTTSTNLAAFHKPYFTFLVNTRGKDGYMQAEFTQGGTKWGLHFKGGNSSFDYNLKTTGWTWVSVELKTDNLEKWGGSGTSFDPKGVIDQVVLGFKLGNGSGNMEVNVDQVMITDGPQKPVLKAFDFEDNVNPYSGSAINGLNQSGIATKSGDKYLTVGLTNAANWNWTGDINKSGPIDLTAVANAYVNFWINTNGKKGFFQLETNQSSVKWGGDLNSSDYFVQTTGWKLYSLRLADINWSKWGGSGTATGLDAKGVLDYLKIGFSTGNVAGGYEVNIDDVYISDGPMF